MTVDPAAIISVPIWPDYCSQCGTELESRRFEERDLPWCPGCEFLFSKGPVPAVQVMVHDEDAVLLVSERHTVDGLWNLPGGAADPREGPREACVRELEEETGLQAEPAALALDHVYHGENPRTDYYLITYALARTQTAGGLVETAEVADARFWPIEAALDNPDKLRESDVVRLERFFAGSGAGKSGAI